VLITTAEGIFRLIDGGTMLGALAKPIKCGCGRMAMFVVNRMGRTRCVECDHQFQTDPVMIGLLEQVKVHYKTSTEPESAQLVPYSASGARYGSGWKKKPRSGA
jgi:hypothetical protein